jgi:protein-disulfide isomerase
MSKKNRERRGGEGGVESTGAGAEGGGGGINWLPIILAIVALGLGFVAWTDGKRMKDETARRLVDIDQKLAQLQTQIANVAKAKPAPQQQGPDPNKVYPVRTDGPTKGNPKAPIVIAEFSDYQ